MSGGQHGKQSSSREKILRRLAPVLEALNQDAPPPCLAAGCEARCPAALPCGAARRLAQRLWHGPPLRAVLLTVRCGCDNACVFCSCPQQVAQITPLSEILADVRRAAGLGIPAFGFTGDEPGNHPDLVQLLRAARQAGFARFLLATNGRSLADPVRVETLVEAGLTDVMIPLLGPTAEVHDRITQRPGSFSETVAAMENLSRHAGLSRTSLNVMLRHNLDHLSAIVRRCRELGFSPEFIAQHAGGQPERLVAHGLSATRQGRAVADLLVACAARGELPPRCYNVQPCTVPLEDPSLAVHLGPWPFEEYLYLHDVQWSQGRPQLGASGDLLLNGFVSCPQAAGCDQAKDCPGLLADYIDVHGSAEFGGGRARARSDSSPS